MIVGVFQDVYLRSVWIYRVALEFLSVWLADMHLMGQLTHHLCWKWLVYHLIGVG